MISCIRYIGLFLFLAVSTSCTTIKPTDNHYALANWVGAYYVDLIHQVGDPISVYIDGLGGRALIYDNLTTMPLTSQLGNYTETFEGIAYETVWLDSFERHTPTAISRQYDIIYVNTDGVIYSSQSNTSDRQVRRQFESNEIVTGVILTFSFIALLFIL